MSGQTWWIYIQTPLGLHIYFIKSSFFNLHTILYNCTTLRIYFILYIFLPLILVKHRHASACKWFYAGVVWSLGNRRPHQSKLFRSNNITKHIYHNRKCFCSFFQPNHSIYIYIFIVFDYLYKN